MSLAIRSVLFLSLVLGGFLPTNASSSEVVPSVPMVRVLSNPGDYQGKVISVAGVFAIDQFSGRNLLYFDEGSMRNRVYLNAVFIVDNEITSSSKGMVGKYVLVTGEFDAASVRNVYAGNIRGVVRVVDYPLIKD